MNKLSVVELPLLSIVMWSQSYIKHTLWTKHPETEEAGGRGSRGAEEAGGQRKQGGRGSRGAEEAGGQRKYGGRRSMGVMGAISPISPHCNRQGP